MSISTTIMNNHFHQQPFLFDDLKNYYSNKLPITSNFSFNPDLLRELNARYLHDMNTNRFSTYLHPKNSQSTVSKIDHNLSLSSTKKSNKWCTAHVRISWMIYHHQQQQQQQLSDFNSNGSNLRLLPFHHGIESIRNHHDLTKLFRKSSSDNSKSSSSHFFSSIFPPIDPLSFSIIEQQRLSAAYASLFHNNNKQFLNTLHLSQQKQYDRINITQINKPSKTKFEELSSINHGKTKRIKRENTISTTT